MATNTSIKNAFARFWTHVSTRVETAKSEANEYTDNQITSAKSVLNTSINSAKQEAINHSNDNLTTAKNDATSKANTALNSAKTYSDTNLATAKTYTNDKIAQYESVQGGVNATLEGGINTLTQNLNQLNESLGSAAHVDSDVFTGYTDTQVAAAEARAEGYADEAVRALEEKLLDNPGGAIDSIYELRDAMQDNKDAIDALREIGSGKADIEHTHTLSQITDNNKKLNVPVDNNGNPIVGQKGYTLLAKGDGTTEWVYFPKIYIGSGEMPEDFDIKLDPNAPALELDATLSIDGAVADAGAVGTAIDKKVDKNEFSEETALAIATEMNMVNPISDNNGSIYTDEKGAVYSL